MFLQIYARAPSHLDSELKVNIRSLSSHQKKLIHVFSLSQWELFQLPQLHCFQAMLNRLYREELEQLVMGYEAFRTALQHEIVTREQSLANRTN